MRILIVHNRYQIPGGEDTVVAQETGMLRGAGLEVETFFASNDGIHGLAASLATAAQVAYSWTMRRRIAAEISRVQPQIVHVHNFFPAITPSVYDAAKAAGCGVVQTLHNYRLVCPSGTLFRDGHVCNDCVDKPVAWPGVLHGCYRGSRAGTAAVAAMLAVNHFRGAWSKQVDRFILLTDFAREFFTRHTDIPAQKMRIKPNAVQDPGVGGGRGGYAFYAGRLSEEKGIRTLLEAAKRGLAMPLRIAGSGPLEPEVREAHAAGHVEYLGPQPPPKIKSLMQDATVLLAPSEWYEGLPMVVPEAYGTGLPVIAGRIGALASLVVPEQTGLLIEPGDPTELTQAVERFAASPEWAQELRRGARQCYETSYRPQTNMKLLLGIYEEILTSR